MTTLVVTHEACLAHDMGYGHPERPDRLRAIGKVLGHELFTPLVRANAPRAELAQIARAHPDNYIQFIEHATPKEGLSHIDGDTALCPGSWEAVLRAAGGAIYAVDQVMTGAAHNAFCALRPPGHHAEESRAMGFCFFNNIALGAMHARAAHGAERVAVVDFDVHHGNGTQDIFWKNKDLFFASTHQMPLFPWTGELSETGVNNNIVNAPLSDGDDGYHFREAFESRVLPALRDFSPDLIMISAGFDGHMDDPLGGLGLTESDYVWATRKLVDVANAHCHGRVVSMLEGGYHLVSLAKSVGVHVRTLMEAGQ